MKTFGKILLTGALALGSFTVMNINTPEAHADGASEYCCYISGPSETVNNFTVQLHATEYGFGQNVIARVTNDKAGDVNYRVTLEKQYATGWGREIWDDGTYHYKVEVANADGSVDTIYTASITVTGR
ncbi:hypothetical protein [Bacillus thuringiensis]|uniref:hypothetical protein n=1 Tax=Bacillus thuringiensis TaxID=1428 RepID=UPI000BF79615|nr:hypothetical protein [Bacillus thuringiensis]PFE24898.1 hypothetical protein CN304_05090 [Bacillus thuringiensis]PFU96492.1 hypothetical protein COK93_14865 [Bacillus thuringiensis]